VAIQPILVDAWNAVTVPMQAASTALIGALQGVVSGWFVPLASAYLVIILFIAMWSGEELAVLRFWRHVLLAALVYSLISALGPYNYYVTGVVNGTMTSLAHAIGGGAPGQSPAQTFNSLAVKAFDVGNSVYKAVPDQSYIKGAGLAFAVALYWTLVQLALWVVFVLYLCSYVLTNYIVGYGIIFIAMYFFEPTYMFFDGWFRAVVAGMLTQTFLIGDLSMLSTVLTGLLHTIGAELNPTGADAADGDIGFMVWDMLGVFGLFVLFAAIAFLSVRLAMAISGGAHAQLMRLPRFGGGRASSASPPALSSSGSGGGSVQPAGPGGGSGGGTASAPRSFAFQTATPMNGPAS
jgi:hypothetical protein